MDVKSSPEASMNDLDAYTLAHIFTFLPVADRMRFQMVSKRWQEASGISLSQLRKLECFDHLDAWDCLEKCTCTMNLQQIRQVLPKCGYKLKHFRCLNCSPVHAYDQSSKRIKADKEFFQLLLDTCPNLEILNITRIHPTDCGLRFAAENYNNLKDFRMNLHSYDLNLSLMYFLTCAKRLSAFTVLWESNDKVTRPNFLEKLPSETLESLSVKFAGYKSNNIDCDVSITLLITNAIKNCPKLKALKINDDGKYFIDGPEVLSYIQTNSLQNNFEFISLAHEFDNAIIISTFKNLRSLELILGSINNDTLNAIGKGCKDLTSLYMNAWFADLTDEGLVNFSNLKHLVLVSDKVKGTFFNSMPKLESVELYCYDVFEIKNFKILFESAKNLKLLRFRGDKGHENVMPKEYANKITRIYHNKGSCSVCTAFNLLDNLI